MNGIALGPSLVLLLTIGGGLLIVALIGSRHRRKGGMVVASILLLLLVAGVSLFFTRIAQSRAMAEQDRAIAMRDQALHKEMLVRESMAASGSHVMVPGPSEEPGSQDDEYPSDESGAEHTASAMDEIHRTTDQAVAALKSEAEATRNAIVKNVQVKTHRPIPPVPPVVVDWQPTRSGLPNRSTRAQVVTGIMLGGVVLAGYFFLNANTRGHYTWRLRIGSTLVFGASLAVILMLCT